MTTQPAKALSTIMRGYVRLFNQVSYYRNNVILPWRGDNKQIDLAVIHTWPISEKNYENYLSSNPKEIDWRHFVSKTLVTYMQQNPDCTLGSYMMVLFPRAMNFTMPFENGETFYNVRAKLAAKLEVTGVRIPSNKGPFATPSHRLTLSDEVHRLIIDMFQDISDGAKIESELINLRFRLS